MLEEKQEEKQEEVIDTTSVILSAEESLVLDGSEYIMRKSMTQFFENEKTIFTSCSTTTNINNINNINNNINGNHQYYYHWNNNNNNIKYIKEIHNYIYGNDMGMFWKGLSYMYLQYIPLTLVSHLLETPCTRIFRVYDYNPPVQQWKKKALQIFVPKLIASIFNYPLYNLYVRTLVPYPISNNIYYSSSSSSSPSPSPSINNTNTNTNTDIKITTNTTINNNNNNNTTNLIATHIQYNWKECLDQGFLRLYSGFWAHAQYLYLQEFFRAMFKTAVEPLFANTKYNYLVSIAGELVITTITYPWQRMYTCMIYTGDSTYNIYRQIRRERGILGYWDGLFFALCQKSSIIMLEKLAERLKGMYMEYKRIKYPEIEKKLREQNNYNIICDICCDEKKQHTFDPCGHCSCTICLAKIPEWGNTKKCPFCRSNISKIIKLYV